MYYWYYALQQSTQQTNNQVFHAITGILRISIWMWGSALQTKYLRIKRRRSFVKYSLKSCSIHQNRMTLHSKSGELFWWRYCIYHGAVDTGNLRVKQHEHCNVIASQNRRWMLGGERREPYSGTGMLEQMGLFLQTFPVPFMSYLLFFFFFFK